MTVQGFMNVVKDFNLCKLLHPNEIYELFKQNSPDHKHIDINGFLELLRDIHQVEMARQSLECDEASENGYINKYLLNTLQMDRVLHRKAYP